MGKKICISVIIVSCLLYKITLSQAPQAISYQAIARDTSGKPLVSQAIAVRFSILDGSTTGTMLYQETHTITTNQLGLFTAKIGKGNPTIGNFSNISWGDRDKFIKVEVDFDSTGNYVLMGTQQLLSVPFAFYANHAHIADSLKNGGMPPIDTVFINSLPMGTDGQTLRYDANDSIWQSNSLLTNDGAHIGIGTDSPKVLGEVNGPFLFGGNFTTTQRDSLVARGQAVPHMWIFNTDRNTFQYYDPDTAQPNMSYLQWSEFLKAKEYQIDHLSITLNQIPPCPPVRLIDSSLTFNQWVAQIKLAISLSMSNDWFHRSMIISTALYNFIPVGDPRFEIDHVMEQQFGSLQAWYAVQGTYTAQWYYDVYNSDTVNAACGGHAVFSDCVLSYSDPDFSIQNYFISLLWDTVNPGGHVINILRNPDNAKWYFRDQDYGVKLTYGPTGEELDADSYMRLFHDRKFDSIVPVHFGTAKKHLYYDRCPLPVNCCLVPADDTVYASNADSIYRHVAPQRIETQFYSLYKPLFDSLGARPLGLPDHVDANDLERRMPGYVQKIWPKNGSHLHADSLYQRLDLIRSTGIIP